MNKNTLLAIGWPATLAGAFIIGKVSDNATPSDALPEQSEEKKVRTVSRSSTSRSVTSLHTGLTAEEAKERIIQIANVSKSEFADNFGIQKIMQISDPIKRASLLLSVMENMSSDDFLTVIDDFRSLGITRQRMGEYRQLLHAWTKVDPLAALAYSQENQSSDTAEAIILASWVKENPAAAIEWAKANFDGNGANPYTVGLIEGLTESDPELATELLNTLPLSTERFESLTFLTNKFANEDHSVGLAWLDTIEDDAVKAAATQRLLSNYVTDDPEAITEWVTNIEDDELRARSLRSVGGSLARENLSDAKEWVSSLDPAQQATAASGIIRNLATENSADALAWVQTMQNQEGYQDLLSSYISAAGSQQDYQNALTQIPNIEDDNRQTQAYADSLAMWHRNDPEAAQAWITSNDIPEEAQQAVERQIKVIERFSQSSGRVRGRGAFNIIQSRVRRRGNE